MTAGAAFAADLPARKEAILPPPPPMWSGFYVGLNAGGGWANSNALNTTSVSLNGPQMPEPLVAAASGQVSAGNAAGFMGGGQIGYNWRMSFGGHDVVAGAEADIQGMTGAGGAGASRFGVTDFVYTTPYVPQPIPGTGVTSMRASKSMDYIGTVRGRIGYLVTPTLLVYGTGGFAYGGVNTNLTVWQDTVRASPNYISGNAAYANTQVGWTAGGGVEWMLAPNWSVKAEYLYYDLGRATMTAVNSLFTPQTATPSFATQATTRFNGNILRAGVNYHLNWGEAAPVLAKY